jgi:hypothetical protein
MDSKYYCQTVSAELTAYKARLYGMIREVENAPEGEQEASSGHIADMNKLVDELTAKIEKLTAECPAEWSDARTDIEDTKSALAEKIDLWDKEHIAGGYVGG